jgi:hypothetical protein
MTIQEQAFRAYYASLTDAELLKIAANKRSYIAVAQEALARELQQRNIERQDGTVAPK